MLSKAQKVIMYISAVLALVLGVVLIIPFRTIPGVTVNSGSVVITVELAVKCCLVLAMLGLSVYPCILKYRQIADRLERSKAVNIMCYFPMAVYLASMLTLNLNTLSYAHEPLGFALWSLVFIVFLLDLAFIVVGFHLLPKLLMKLNRNMTIFLDIALGVISAGIIIVTCVLNTSYLNAYESVESFFGVGSPILFFVYLMAIVGFVVLAHALLKVVKKDEVQLYINFDLQEQTQEEVKLVEYRHAYNDILDDFEAYFEENGNLEPEMVEEAIDQIEEEEIQEEEIQEEEIQEEEISQDLSEELARIEAEKARLEAERAQIEAEKARLEAEKSAVIEKPVTPVIPKPEKVFAPSYNSIVRYAGRSRKYEIKTSASSNGKSHRFYIQNKLYLLTQRTSSAYRIYFLAMPTEAFELIVEYPGVVTKPKSPKGPQWFMVQNSGTMPEEFLRTLIDKSAQNLSVIEEEKRLEKEKAKEAARLARAEARAKAREEAKKAREAEKAKKTA